MLFKIELRSWFKDIIEELRKLHGNYHSVVFRFDVLINDEFVSLGYAEDFVKSRVDSLDMVKIVEVRE